jgi:hypothetical protein
MHNEDTLGLKSTAIHSYTEIVTQTYCHTPHHTYNHILPGKIYVRLPPPTTHCHMELHSITLSHMQPFNIQSQNIIIAIIAASIIIVNNE